MLPCTCLVCHEAWDVSITGDVRASSIYIRRVHDSRSPHCTRPEITVVEQQAVITLEFAEDPKGPVTTKVSAPYLD